MEYKVINWDNLSVKVTIATFLSQAGITEYHAMIEVNNNNLSAEKQFNNIEESIDKLQESLENTSLVLKRYFVSDTVNQADFLKEAPLDSATSIVQQAPLNGSKVSVWTYWVSDSKVKTDSLGNCTLERPAYRHLYSTQLQKPMLNEYAETDYIFETYTETLKKYNCKLKDNCIRTWIYVQGVDIHYKKMVEARSAYFEREYLTSDTHYIASTGIEGKHLDPNSLVLMDAYAIEGIEKEQIKYLQGLTHLNPTYEYGVTFERATAVDYGDRRHIYVSGTASIDNKGAIVYPTKIEKQIERTLENIEVLLNEGDAQMDDIAQMIVYLRDTADYEFVSSYMNKHYPSTPKVIVWAPVCRPGWLIEIECIAIKEIRDNGFECF